MLSEEGRMKKAAGRSRGSLRLAGAIAAIAVLLALCPAAHAQEVQVPLDHSGRLMRIDAQLAKRLGTLTDQYPGFTEARLFRAADSTFVFEVTMARGGQVLRERVPYTAAGVDSLRASISMRVAEKAPQAALNQEGRALLVTATTLLGLGFYGWALPYAGDVQGDQSAGGLYLLTSAASFFIPFAATDDQAVSYGMTDLALYGSTRGIVHGILVYQLFKGSENTSQGNVGSALAGSLAEGVGGYIWAQHSDLGAGDAQTIGTLGDFGLLEGLGFTALADNYDHNENEAAAATMLAGSAAGIAGGALLAGKRAYSYGDASVMRNAGLLGVFAAEMVTDWFNPEDKAYVTAAMIGGPIGLAIGDRLVANTDFNVGQSVLVTLGMVAGATFGLGVGYLSSGANSDNGTALLTSSMIGAGLGFVGTYRSFLPAARASRTGSSWRIELSPLAALAAQSPRASAVTSAPLVRVSCRF
jgi:hypothetical protein